MTDLEDFGKRLKVAAEKVGGQDSLSKEAGISTRALTNYIAGVNDVKRETLVKIAQVSGLSLQWLATGEETDQHDKGQLKQSDEAITADVVEETIAALYAYLEGKGLQMPSSSVGRAAAILCEMAAAMGGIDESKIERILKLRDLG